MAKDKTAQNLSMVVPNQILVLSGVLEGIDSAGNVTFTFKKPRSSKYINQVFPKSKIVYINDSSNGGSTLAVLGDKVSDLGEVSNVKLSNHFMECSSVSGKFIVNSDYMKIQAEVDEPSGGGKKKSKKDKKAKKK